MTLTPRLTPTTPPVPSRRPPVSSPRMPPNVWMPVGVSLEDIPIINPTRVSTNEMTSPQCKRLHREPSSPHAYSAQCGINVRVNEQEISILRISESKMFAVQSACPHMGAKLVQGGRILLSDIEDLAIECPLHRLRFDLSSGKLLSNGPVDDLKTFPVRIKDGQVEVGFESMVLTSDNF